MPKAKQDIMAIVGKRIKMRRHKVLGGGEGGPIVAYKGSVLTVVDPKQDAGAEKAEVSLAFAWRWLQESVSRPGVAELTDEKAGLADDPGKPERGRTKAEIQSGIHPATPDAPKASKRKSAKKKTAKKKAAKRS